MTPMMLVDAIAEECRLCFEGQRFKGAGGVYAPLNVYPHELPAPLSFDDPAVFPFVLVRIEKATQTGPDSPMVSKVEILAGTYDEEVGREDFQGYRDPYSILWRLSEHIYGLGVIGGFFEPDFPWSIDTGGGEYFPSFFALMSCAFNMQGLRETASQLAGRI